MSTFLTSLISYVNGILNNAPRHSRYSMLLATCTRNEMPVNNIPAQRNICTPGSNYEALLHFLPISATGNMHTYKTSTKGFLYFLLIVLCAIMKKCLDMSKYAVLSRLFSVFPGDCPLTDDIIRERRCGQKDPQRQSVKYMASVKSGLLKTYYKSMDYISLE